MFLRLLTKKKEKRKVVFIDPKPKVSTSQNKSRFYLLYASISERTRFGQINSLYETLIVFYFFFSCMIASQQPINYSINMGEQGRSLASFVHNLEHVKNPFNYILFFFFFFMTRSFMMILFIFMTRSSQFDHTFGTSEKNGFNFKFLQLTREYIMRYFKSTSTNVPDPLRAS